MIRAARYLGVAPWELSRQPVTWRDWALTAESAENQAEAERLKRSSRQWQSPPHN